MTAGRRGRAVSVRAPAKVNLSLRVGPVRDDGYHELATIYQAVSLHDEVVAEPAEGLHISVSGESAAKVPAGPTNLAAKAATLLARHVGVSPDVALSIRKHIPVAGGMAGGSADAAAALVACDALWECGLDRATLLGLAAQLGSDVPFSLAGGTAIGTGRGERLTPALTRGEFHWVFGLAEGGLSTPEVYAECDRLRAGRRPAEVSVSDAVMHALRGADAVGLGAALANDLQDAACSLRPELRQALEIGLDYGALGAVVSGSGPTTAFLVPDEEAAMEVSVALTASGVCRDVRRATGPVPGARVVSG
ncbi:MAG: 4-(cytidine 5'-diphospho)-2-C-methyl-D-erythritol kinase [Actinomycetales bacterium]